MSCGNQGCEKNHCGACCGGGCGQSVSVTPGEVDMLWCFAQTPFLPVAAKSEQEGPVYLEDRSRSAEDYKAIILSLRQKGLIRLDYDLPLSNFDYQVYREYPLHGSMALTARGQAVVELMEIQGIEG